MKAFLIIFVIGIVVYANPNKAVDIEKEPLVITKGNSAWFKVKILRNQIWHADSDDPNLMFNEVGGTVIGDYQYFHVMCKRKCSSGEVYSIFLTETRTGNLRNDQPLAILAYFLYIA